MKQQDAEKIFAEINKLYEQYHEVSLKKNDADFSSNYSVAYKSARDKLIIAVCKLYFKFEHSEGSNEKIQAVTVRNKNDDNYSDIVLETTIIAMDSYEESGSKEKGCFFSQFVCLKINQAKGKEQSKKIISSNQGGRTVSDYESNMIRRVMKKDAELEKFGIFDENKRNEKIALLLTTDSHNVSVEMVIRFKQLAKNQTMRTEQESTNGDNYSVLDLEKNLQEKNFITPESEFLENELREQLPLLLNEMECIFNEKADKKVADLLAVSLLDCFEPMKKTYIQSGNQIKDFYPFVYELLSRYCCLEQSIVRRFFTEPDYSLPTQKDIIDKYGLGKSAASKILSRFREKLKHTENVEKYFSDFL